MVFLQMQLKSVPTDVNIEAIVGGIVGGLALLIFATLFMAILVWLCCLMHRKKSGKSMHQYKCMYTCMYSFIVYDHDHDHVCLNCIGLLTLQRGGQLLQ